MLSSTSVAAYIQIVAGTLVLRTSVVTGGASADGDD
jgi:hypothetical protein